MAIAGYNSAVTAATGSGATFSEMGGIKSLSIGDSRDLLDITDFADGNVRARLAALRDISCELSGDYEPTDAGLLKLLACRDAGSDVCLKLYTSAAAPTSGFGYIFQVASVDIDSTVEGKAEVSISLMINSSSGTHSFSL